MIDNIKVTAQDGKTILEVAEKFGIFIPHICYHRFLPAIGRCKVCIVKADGKFVTSCETKVYSGMNIEVSSEELDEIRQTNIRLMLESVDFHRLPERFKSLLKGGIESLPQKSMEKLENPFFSLDKSLCFLCGKCVSACSNLQGRFIYNFKNKGEDLTLIVGKEESFEKAGCEFCGTCTDFCPTGAISDKNKISANPQKTETVCSYCGVGCQIELSYDGRQIYSRPVQNAKEYQSLCVKGRYGHSYILHEDRLKNPMVRRYLIDGKNKFDAKDRELDFVEVSWEKALEVVSEKLIDIFKSFGSNALAFMSSAKCTNEENYLLQKVARQIFKTNNIDHCARLCHSSTVAGLIESIGSGAMTNSMEDIVRNAKTIFIIGSNVTEQHPVFGVKIRRAVMNRKINLIVADPRFTDISQFSDVYLNIKIGSDIYLLNAICKIILENNWQDEDFIKNRCENYDEFRISILQTDLLEASQKTGIKFEDIYNTARLIATEKPTAVIWAMGVTQHIFGVDNVLAVANLQLLTGNVGVSGGGLNPLRGQNNVQGSCDMGALPDMFSGYQKVTDISTIDKFSKLWGFENDTHLSNITGLTVTEMIENLGKNIKTLYIMGENPAMTEPDINKVTENLKRCNFLVVQDIFPTETSKYADVILPASSFAEKSGTFTNTERRIQKLSPLFKPLYNSKTDFEIITKLANLLIKKMNCIPLGEFSSWDYKSYEDVMWEINKTTPIYEYVAYHKIKNKPLYWPVNSKNHDGSEILHKESFPLGKGKFHVVTPQNPHEMPDKEFPLILNTGRELYHWHGGELTRRVAELMKVSEEPIILIHPEDAKIHHLTNNSKVKVTSKRGEICAKVFLTERVAKGTIFGNFHFPQGNVNYLTAKRLDPKAKIPQYKISAVSIKKIWEGKG